MMRLRRRDKRPVPESDQRPIPTRQDVHDCISAIVYAGLAEGDLRGRANAGARALQMTADYRLVADVEGEQEAYSRLCWIRDHLPDTLREVNADA